MLIWLAEAAVADRLLGAAGGRALYAFTLPPVARLICLGWIILQENQASA
jgi:hypothetical protein